MTTKADLEAENARLRSQIDELHEEIDKLKGPAEDKESEIVEALMDLKMKMVRSISNLKSQLESMIDPT